MVENINYMSLKFKSNLCLVDSFEQLGHAFANEIKPNPTRSFTNHLTCQVEIWWVYLEQHEGESMPEISFWYNHFF